ncbi:MAG: HlyD family secretion protein [Planctomycetaceae bacterium]
MFALTAGCAAVWIARGGPSVVYRGQITARIIPVTAEQDGVLVRWHVAEGDPIRIGDAIVSISNPSLVETRRQLEQQIARLSVDLDRALAQADLDLEWRIKDVNAEIFNARLQSAELLEEKYRHEMERVALADVLTSNSTALWMPKDTVFDSIVLQDSENQQGRLSAVLRVEAAANSADVCSAQVEMCEEQVEALEHLRDSLPERVRRSVGADVVERQLEAARQSLELLSAEQPEMTITSTVIGQAGVFVRKPGDYVRTGDRIIEIFDDVLRYVVVDVPSGGVDAFKAGREFPLTFPGGVERRGRVIRVAPQAVATNSGGETVVRVHLEPAGLLWPRLPIESQILVGVP